MEIDIERLKELIGQREAIDAEIFATVGTMPARVRKQQSCGACGQPGHSSRTCPQKAE